MIVIAVQVIVAVVALIGPLAFSISPNGPRACTQF